MNAPTKCPVNVEYVEAAVAIVKANGTDDSDMTVETEVGRDCCSEKTNVLIGCD